MALPIVWTKNAIEDYQQIIDYLLQAWPLFVAENFVSTIEIRTKTLSKFPLLGLSSKKEQGVRSIVITKHNKLFYRISPDKIEILTIFDTRQNPEKSLYQ